MKSMHEVTITIDNQTVSVAPDLTVLQAAARSNIYIPTLCAHKDLTPFGGCRMCIVEVEGMRGLPTACTTPVQAGMVVRTHTAQVHATRLEILQLILSEHTSSCLICEEREECRLYSATIRKAGVTTGCRYCSNDNRCELQDVVTRLGLQDIDYPIYYRNLPVEKSDPFFDRDYNLCILCGRCVRMCQEVRAAGTLAFTQRGRRTVIGTAFHRSHIDAGCEFCGACVSVCPTGALAEKTNKWEGPADREATTTCPLCGIGCQLRAQAKGALLLGSLPEDDPLINHGQLCVKGRFCLPELTNGPERLLAPYRIEPGSAARIDWDQAIDLAAARLADCRPEDFGMLVSPNCHNEDLYVAQKFVRSVMRSHNIDNSGRSYYGAAFNAYLKLFSRSVPLASLETAPVIVAFGLDARFGRSVVGVELRRAAKKGARIISLHPGPHSLSAVSHVWIRPAPGALLAAVRSLAGLTARADAGEAPSGAGEGELGAQLALAAGLLREAGNPVFLVGSDFLHGMDSGEILEAIHELAALTGAGLLPLPAQNNLLGALFMGAVPELLPGSAMAADRDQAGEIGRSWGIDLPEHPPEWNALTLSPARRLKVLYLVGEEIPNPAALADFVVYQNIYPPAAPLGSGVLLPAASFGEAEGTFCNGEGRLQSARQIVAPPGEALPDWQIFCRLARKLNAPGFAYADSREIQHEISSLIPELEDMAAADRKCRPLALPVVMAVPTPASCTAGKDGHDFPLLMQTRAFEHSFRGYPLSRLVEGARSLFDERAVIMNPADAARAGIANGDEVLLDSDHFEEALPARLSPEQPEGVLLAMLPHRRPWAPNPLPVRIRKRDVQGN